MASKRKLNLPNGVEGDGNKPLAVLLHGFPDDYQMWDPQMELLLKKYRVVRPNLPNFGGSVTDKWGVSVHEIERRIESCIQDARRDGEKITLIAHDWGAAFAFWVEHDHPDWIENMVILDVGGHLEVGFFFFLFLIVYQSLFSFAWVLSLLPLVGKPLGHLVQTLNMSILLAPLLKKVPAKSKPSVEMCYIYFWFWVSIFTFSPPPMINLRDPFSFTIPKCPILFVWGGDRPNFTRFFSKSWEAAVRAKPHNRTLEFPAARHWLNWDSPEEFNLALGQFLDIPRD